MAKRRYSRPAPAPRRRSPTYRAAARHYRSRGGAVGIMGAFKPVLAGAIGGAAAQYARAYNAQFGGAVAQAAVGYFMKNDTLMTMAGIEAGHNLLTTVTTTTTTSGGF